MEKPKKCAECGKKQLYVSVNTHWFIFMGQWFCSNNCADTWVRRLVK